MSESVRSTTERVTVTVDAEDLALVLREEYERYGVTSEAASRLRARLIEVFGARPQLTEREKYAKTGISRTVPVIPQDKEKDR